mmetsp:Transcript_18451/g.37704  ORF Transcript_18451/g.37704 Transcript_18451/m.37704 type:complete len:306 (-) Transcript_18451:1259-2176(-)
MPFLNRLSDASTYGPEPSTEPDTVREPPTYTSPSRLASPVEVREAVVRVVAETTAEVRVGEDRVAPSRNSRVPLTVASSIVDEDRVEDVMEKSDRVLPLPATGAERDKVGELELERATREGKGRREPEGPTTRKLPSDPANPETLSSATSVSPSASPSAVTLTSLAFTNSPPSMYGPSMVVFFAMLSPCTVLPSSKWTSPVTLRLCLRPPTSRSFRTPSPDQRPSSFTVRRPLPSTPTALEKGSMAAPPLAISRTPRESTLRCFTPSSFGLCSATLESVLPLQSRSELREPTPRFSTLSRSLEAS